MMEFTEKKRIKANLMKKKHSPWAYIPSLYFAEGVPYVLVNELSVPMFKTLGADNIFIGMTSFLYLPWAIKFLWSPLLDSHKTKRYWLLFFQFLLTISFIILGLCIYLPNNILFSLIIFTLIAFLSASHDIAIDGYYLYALGKKDQAFFSGIRSTFYRFAKIFAGGILVMIAGAVNTAANSNEPGWVVAFIIAGAIFSLLFILHRFILPYPETDIAVVNQQEDIEINKCQARKITIIIVSTLFSFILTMSVFGIIFKLIDSSLLLWTLIIGIAITSFILVYIFLSVKKETEFVLVFDRYFTQKKIGFILAFILLYRFGEGILIKMVQPFLIDSLKQSGLTEHTATSSVGFMYGTLGITALIIGGILGGWLLKKLDIKRILLPFAILMHLPNVLFIVLANSVPFETTTITLPWLDFLNFKLISFEVIIAPLAQIIVIVEQFCYGLGFTAFIVYLLYISVGNYKTSFYAISTGIMAIGMMVPGFISGFIQQAFGYSGVFTASILTAIPGLIIIVFLPYKE